MGALLIVLAAGVLAVDQRLKPWAPFLFVLLLGLAEAACYELLHLLPPPRRPAGWLCSLGVAGLVTANWAAAVCGWEPWRLIAGVFGAVVLAAFLVEMARFRGPGESVTRIALTVWTAAYLGLLPCFLAQLRWLPERVCGDPSTTALALAIFVPKCCDIGAYFSGRFLGRHHMAPVLSPKKTWEGAAGGLAASVAAAFAINRLGPAPALYHAWWVAVGFGLTVGLGGMFGDLAESLVKRDCQQKDASQAVPGFGGVLDVVDAVILAGPVAYWWLR
jgi:phosphatidate cytidylyltransferase